jgi:hypothetical protein
MLCVAVIAYVPPSPAQHTLAGFFFSGFRNISASLSRSPS